MLVMCSLLFRFFLSFPLHVRILCYPSSFASPSVFTEYLRVYVIPCSWSYSKIMVFPLSPLYRRANSTPGSTPPFFTLSSPLFLTVLAPFLLSFSVFYRLFPFLPFPLFFLSPFSFSPTFLCIPYHFFPFFFFFLRTFERYVHLHLERRHFSPAPSYPPFVIFSFFLVVNASSFFNSSCSKFTTFYVWRYQWHWFFLLLAFSSPPLPIVARAGVHVRVILLPLSRPPLLISIGFLLSPFLFHSLFSNRNNY